MKPYFSKLTTLGVSLSILVISICVIPTIALAINGVGSSTQYQLGNQMAATPPAPSPGWGQGDINAPDNSPDASIVGTILDWLFRASALLSVIFIAIGGFKYTTSAGDPQGLQGAKNTIMYAIIGLVVSILALTIVTYVISKTGY